MLDTLGKPLIVTGASHGIGRAVALLLAGRGLPLVLCARSAGALAEAVAQCRSLGSRVQGVAGNVAQDTTCRALLREAADLGGVFGAIHAAGVLHPGMRLWEMSELQVHQVWDANVYGAMCLIRAVTPQLLAQGRGVMVLFGSGAAEQNLPGLGIYSASKAAEEHLGRQLMIEAPQLDTIIFRPGLVETRMQEQARRATGGAARQGAPALQGLSRLGPAEHPATLRRGFGGGAG